MTHRCVRRVVMMACALMLAVTTGLVTGVAATVVSRPTDAYASVAGGKITRAEIIQRAKDWYNWNTTAYASQCAPMNASSCLANPDLVRCVCNEASAMAPDIDGDHRYRRDCSGFVAMALHLTTSPTSTQLGTGAYGQAINATELQPGDYLTMSGHVVLFEAWAPAYPKFTYYGFGGSNDGELHKLHRKLGDFSGAATHDVFYDAAGFSGGSNGANEIDGHPTSSYQPTRYNNVLGRTQSDVNGDGKSDFVLHRPSDHGWYVRYANGSTYAPLAVWGQNGDVPLDGDFNADGRSDMMVFRPSTGQWLVWYAGAGAGVQLNPGIWGGSGDVPLDGDYDGDGKADMMIFRPSTGQWLVWYTGTSVWAQLNSSPWGQAGDIPLDGDFNGDGRSDMMVFRPSTGQWLVWYAGAAAGTQLNPGTWGGSGDVPLDGDYDGDGKADMMIFRPSTGQWLVWYTGTSIWAQLNNTQWGGSGDVPLDGDYDGDGKADMMIFRPSNGSWNVLYASGVQAVLTTSWGAATDIAM